MDGISETASAIGTGPRVRYQYSVAGVAGALQDTYRKLPDDQKSRYLDDIKSLFGYFYELHCGKNLTLYESPGFAPESNWVTLTPGITGFSVLSGRGGGKIIHGWKLNIGYIASIAGTVTGSATSLLLYHLHVAGFGDIARLVSAAVGKVPHFAVSLCPISEYRERKKAKLTQGRKIQGLQLHGSILVRTAPNTPPLRAGQGAGTGAFAVENVPIPSQPWIRVRATRIFQELGSHKLRNVGKVTQKSALRVVENRYQSVTREFVDNRMLARYDSSLDQARFVESTISRLIGI